MSDYLDPAELDPAFLRGLTQRRMSRRDMLKYTGAAMGTLGLASVLGPLNPAEAKGINWQSWWAKQKKAGVVNFANWPLYIDKKQVHGHTVHPSLQEFTRKTGIKVNYSEVIQDYQSFFGKIRPELAAGQGIGYDLIVMGYPRWLPLMIRLGYLVPLDKRRLPHFWKYGGSFIKNPSYDPGNKYSIPWQSGITGIGYNPKLTGREITSLKDLIDPKFKGKVGMFGDTEDLPNTALLAIGVNPVHSTPKDWRRAAEWLEKQKSEGIVRKYYDQSYIDALTRGDVWLSQAWSGDIFQANESGAPNLKFVVPKEGGLLWNDCMCIPLHVSHPVDAIELMDFYYRPDVAAMVTEYIHYITPVPSSRKYILRDAKHAKGKERTQYEHIASSALVFPTKRDLSRLYRYRDLTPSEQAEWDNLFEPIYQS
jgi:spermidine/putrescine transport system substrate-binding protein